MNKITIILLVLLVGAAAQGVAWNDIFTGTILIIKARSLQSPLSLETPLPVVIPTPSPTQPQPLPFSPASPSSVTTPSLPPPLLSTPPSSQSTQLRWKSASKPTPLPIFVLSATTISSQVTLLYRSSICATTPLLSSRGAETEIKHSTTRPRHSADHYYRL